MMTSYRSYLDGDIQEIIVNHAKQEELVLYHDLDSFTSTCSSLVQSFPSNFLHTYAIKSNPLPELSHQNGLGLEAASLVELELCIRSGCENSKIVFDSPAKTIDELIYALRLGVRINVDNEEEIRRIGNILNSSSFQSTSLIGVRVNPMVGSGQIDLLSTADMRSKFGIPLNKLGKDVVLNLFKEYSFLTGLHCHVGSMGCSMDMLVQGASIIESLANEIDSYSNSNRIRYLDIGGGLSVNSKSSEILPTFLEFSNLLREKLPSVFDNPNRTIITEFGKAIVAKTAFACCKVEYVKSSYLSPNDNNETCNTNLDQIVVIHAGADLFLRTAYSSSKFPLRLSVYTPEGILKDTSNRSELILTDIVGPLCFSGDKIATSLYYPVIIPNDYIIVHDVGGNSINLWSRHCSRQSPTVYGYYRKGEKLHYILLKEKEKVEDVINFWASGFQANDLNDFIGIK